MNVILHGTIDIAGMAKAAEQAVAFEAERRSADGTDKLKDLGLRVDGKFYLVRFNRTAVSVWCSK